MSMMTITPTDMREMERAFMEGTGYPPVLLMEHAAQAVAETLLRMTHAGARATFVCGGGNNGGDGFAAARLWLARGGRARVVALQDISALSGDARLNAQLLSGMGAEILTGVDALLDLESPGEAVVDAIFGTGLTRDVRGDYALAVDWINRSGVPVLAVDIPSGVDGATGEIRGCAVRATETVTFHRPKYGHYLFPGRTNTGKLTVADIGIFPEWDDADGARVLSDTDVQAMLAPRAQDAHKGSFGRVLIAAGSRGMAGAAALCALGCVRSGAGLTRVACPQGVLEIVQALCPCATATPLAEADGAIACEAQEELTRLARENDVLAIGPGLSTKPGAWEAIRALVMSDQRKVLDADALNLLAQHPETMAGQNTVITPHPGEAARLLGVSIADITAAPLESAQELSQRTGAVVLLKGATSVITDGEEVTLNLTGCPGMAKGGSGDVLTGVIAALMAQGLAPYEAASLGAFLHGRAGERAQEAYGERAMTAMELSRAL